MTARLFSEYQLQPAEQQPTVTEIQLADDMFVKAIRFHKAGDVGNQHKHAYDHVSVVTGPMMVWIGDEQGIRDDAPFFKIGEQGAPSSITVPAHRFHRFAALQDGVILLCIHRLHDGKVAVEEYAAPMIPADSE